jgi:cell division protein FtsQ
LSGSTTAPSRPGIDPRIRARRIEVQRDVGRRRLRRLVVAVGAVGVLGALGGVAMTPLLDVDHLAVTGAARSGAAAVAAATGIHRGDPMLTAHLGRAAGRITALPWVQTVRVRRSWPGTIHIDVVERRAEAAVPARAGGWILLDATGRQLAVGPDPGQGVLHVEAQPVQPQLGTNIDAGDDAALQLAGSIPAPLRAQVLSLRPTPGGEVEGRVILRNGGKATILLGRPTQAEAKWLALLSVLNDTDPARLDRIDLRVPSAPALTRH